MASRTLTGVELVDAFEFNVGVTPLSWLPVPLATCALYLLAVFTIKKLVNEKKKALELTNVVMAYNFTMSALSGVLWYFLVKELLAIQSRDGFFALFCDPFFKNNCGLLVVIYYVNYIFKYVELVDTIFLCLRHKQTPFIHVYHHAITLLLCWTQLSSRTCLQWVPIVLNLFVHIWLYAYYGLYELKVDIWWKKYLTSLQIVQFMIALAASLIGIGGRALYDLTPRSLGLGMACTGSWFGSFFGLAIIISYLYLFIELYNDRYKAEAAAAKKKKLSLVGGGKSASASAVNPAPDINSTFSPHYKSGVWSRPQGVTPSVVAAAVTVPAHMSAEDRYPALREAWLNHPLIATDRARWMQYEATIAATASVPSTSPKDGAGEASPAKAKRIAEWKPHKPACSLQRRFGTDVARL